MTVPMGVVRACLRMLPRLDSEEAIETSLRAAVGSGNVKPDARQRITRAWERQARPPAKTPQGPFVRMSPGAAEVFGMRRVKVQRPEPSGG